MDEVAKIRDLEIWPKRFQCMECSQQAVDRLIARPSKFTYDRRNGNSNTHACRHHGRPSSGIVSEHSQHGIQTFRCQRTTQAPGRGNLEGWSCCGVLFRGLAWGYARALQVPESLRVIPRLKSKRMPASPGLGKPASNSGRSGGVHVLLVSGGCIDIDDLRPLNIVFDRILSNVLKFFHDLKNSLDVLLEQKEPLPARLV